MVLIIGAVLMGLLGAAIVLSGVLDGADPDPDPSDRGLTPLEATLGRPIVLYIDGPEGRAFRDRLTALDAGRGALADRAVPRTLVDLDVYVMLRADWDVFRAIEGHDLGAVIRANAQDKAPDAGVAWFEASVSAPQGGPRRVLVILATEAARANIGDFCFAVTVYDLARYARNGPAFLAAASGPGSNWKQCRKMGWTGVADLPADG